MVDCLPTVHAVEFLCRREQFISPATLAHATARLAITPLEQLDGKQKAAPENSGVVRGMRALELAFDDVFERLGIEKEFATAG